MLGLQKTTEFNKRISKQKFYENLTVFQTLKKVFTEQVMVIYWRNKIAASTMNIAPGNAAFKVNRYYSTDWQEADSLTLKADGFSIDAIYESFIRQIAGDTFVAAAPGESIKETVNREKKQEALKKQIEKLQTKIRKEKQLNRQMQMNGELKKLKIELEENQNG